MVPSRSLSGAILVASILLVACDKAKPKEAEEEGTSVKAYCAKMLDLDEATASKNRTTSDKEGPSRTDLMRFCKVFMGTAKDEEPEAYECMAKCMLGADSREDEQTCVTKKKCLAKAKNKKVFSNRAD